MKLKKLYLMTTLALFTPILFSSGCKHTAEDSYSKGSKDSSTAFNDKQILKLSITMPPQDWDKLRVEGRDFSSLQCDSSNESPYEKYKADISMDGSYFKGVTIRKKGFLGSLLQDKPSLKIKLGKGEEFNGLDRFSFNNDRQDSSHLKQCLTYDIFASYGLLAPRCRFTEVTVNGRNLGVYTQVEEVKKDFLHHHLGSSDYTIFEGTLSDFTSSSLETFELKYGDHETTVRNKFLAIAKILESGSKSNLVQKLSQHIDMDQFFKFWALESLVAHWDGYANNRNNYYVLYHPATDKLTFIPWGVDQVLNANDIFLRDDPVNRHGQGQWVSTKAALPHILMADQEGRAKYIATMKSLISSWPVSRILGKIESFQNLLGDQTPSKEVDLLKTFASNRGKDVLASLNAADPKAVYDNRKDDSCTKETGTISGNFSGIWNTAPIPFKGSIKLQFKGETIAFQKASLGFKLDAIVGSPQPAITYMGSTASGKTYVIKVLIETPLFKDTNKVSFHGVSTFGMFLEIVSGKPQLQGYISNGTVNIEKAGISEKSEIKGSIDAKIYSMTF